MSGELDIYDIPFEGVEATVIGWVREALELRHGAANDPKGKLTVVTTEEGIPALQDMLIRVRQRSDRVDELLSKVTQAKGRAKRAQDEARFLAEVALDTALDTNAAHRTREFVTREERNADAKLRSLEQRRHAHRSERLVSITSESYDVINQIHWQLDAIRKDLRATLHSLQFESSLER